MNVVVECAAGRKAWIGLALLVVPCLVYAMDLTVLNLALPSLAADLAPSGPQVLWIVDIYGFMVAGFLITMGNLGDRIGRRRLLLFGAAAFAVASVVAARATSPEMLIVARALLGIAGATVAPSTLSLIRTMFPDPRQRTTAIGVWVTSYSVGGAIGPVVGGVLLERFGWGSVFLPAVPAMAALVLLGPALLPEFRDPDAGPPDIASAALSLLAVLALIFGLKGIAHDGLHWGPVAAVAVGVAAGATFLRRQRSLPDPLVDLRLFQRPVFGVSLATYALGAFASFGVFVATAQYLQSGLGLSPLAAGLWTVPWSVAFIVGVLLTPWMSRRVRPATMVVGGLAVAGVGFVLLAGVDARSGLALAVAASVVSSLGLAPVFTLATDLVVGAAPPERAGAAGALSEAGAELGGALGIAVLGSVGAAVYRSNMAEAAGSADAVGLAAAGLSPAVTGAAHDTLAGAVEMAAALPASQAAALLDAARAAFAHAFALTGIAAAATVFAVAVAAALLLSREETRSRARSESLAAPPVAPAIQPRASGLRSERAGAARPGVSIWSASRDRSRASLRQRPPGCSPR